MNKKRQLEVVISRVFIICIFLIFFYGFKYFGGFQSASSVDRGIISVLGIVFLACVLYFIFRFCDWVVRRIRMILRPDGGVTE